MKRFLLFTQLLIVLLYGCSVELKFEDNKRLFIVGSLIDEQGEPIPNVSVEVSARIPGGVLSGSDDEILGFGMTNTEGLFEITAISTSNADIVRVLINSRNGVRLAARYNETSLDLMDFISTDGLRFHLERPIVLTSL